jgi:hypothetical protein
MAKINFDVDDEMSGNQALLEDIEDTLSVQNFLAELSEHGFGPFNGYFEVHVDGQGQYPLSPTPRHPFSMATGLEGSLSAMGVKDGSLFEIRRQFAVCGPGSSKITFFLRSILTPLRQIGTVNYTG